MSHEHRTVKEVVRKLGQNGDIRVAVVLCSDGKLGVTRDGELMPDAQWTVDKMSECVKFAERIAQG